MALLFPKSLLLSAHHPSLTPHGDGLALTASQSWRHGSRAPVKPRTPPSCLLLTHPYPYWPLPPLGCTQASGLLGAVPTWTSSGFLMLTMPSPGSNSLTWLLEVQAKAKEMNTPTAIYSTLELHVVSAECIFLNSPEQFERQRFLGLQALSHREQDPCPLWQVLQGLWASASSTIKSQWLYVHSGGSAEDTCPLVRGLCQDKC